MVEISVLYSTHNLKDNPIDYYNLFHDIRGNWLGSLIASLQSYELLSEEKFLEIFEKNVQINQVKFKEIIKEIVEIMKIEKVEEKNKRLFLLIKLLGRISDFDWSDVEKFKKFYSKYTLVLSKLKKLK